MQISSDPFIEATIHINMDEAQIDCIGNWTANGLNHLRQKLISIQWGSSKPLTLNGHDLNKLDSAGAWVIHQFKKKMQLDGMVVRLTGFNTEQKDLIQLLENQSIVPAQPVATPKHTIFHLLGFRICRTISQSRGVFAFIGEVTHYLIRTCLRPAQVQFKELFSVIEQTGYHALPIIALLSYLVGVVLAYQMGLQLKNYGANIYVVDLLGLSILREFGPLITAIIVAGRTGAAYTAEIGTMKVNEEIDALKTIGVPPMQILSLPRILGLIIVLPLLTIWADLFGLLGGMVMSNSLLDIDFYNFVDRFHAVVAFRTYWLGMIKTPVFALLIASVGCYHGFQVSGGADSVGRETTKSVVHSIFLIIVADAIFSVIFGWQNV